MSVDFIKDTRGCYPRFYVIGRDGASVEMQAVKWRGRHPGGRGSRINRQPRRGGARS